MDTLILNSDGTPLSLLPLSVVPWQTAIRLLSLGKVRVIKNYDDWVVRSPNLELNVPSVLITTQYMKWTRFVKFNRGNVYLRDDHTCQYCGKRFKKLQLSLDHVLPKSHGGSTQWENIVTSCRKCNSHKGDDPNIVPKNMPRRPNYYELAAKRRKMPIKIRDRYWLNFLDWPEELVQIIPRNNGETHVR